MKNRKTAMHYEFTTGIMHAEFSGVIINYRLVKCGLESYWWMDGSEFLVSAIDMGLLEAYVRSVGEIKIDTIKIAEPTKRQPIDEVYYSFFYDHADDATQGVKWPSLAEAIKHVNLDYEIAGIASNTDHRDKPVHVKFRLVEDSTDFIKVYFNGELMFAEQDMGKISPVLNAVSDFFGETWDFQQSDGIETLTIKRD